MATLGFEDYIDPLKVYLIRYREGDAKGSARSGDDSAKRFAVGILPGPNTQFLPNRSLSYINSQGQHMIIPSMQNNEYEVSTFDFTF